MDSIKLPVFSERETQAALAKAKGEALLKSLPDPRILWCYADQGDSRVQMASGKAGRYLYQAHNCVVSICYWGDQEEQLVLVFSAPFSEPLSFCDQFIQSLSVYYRVHDDGTISWAAEE